MSGISSTLDYCIENVPNVFDASTFASNLQVLVQLARMVGHACAACIASSELDRLCTADQIVSQKPGAIAAFRKSAKTW